MSTRKRLLPHVGTLDFSLHEKFRPVQLDLGAHRNHPDDGGGTAALQHLEALLCSNLQTDCLEAVVHAATGELANRLDRVGFFGVDHVGGAELARQFELLRHHVDGDDASGSGNGRAVDGRQPNTAAADHRHVGAGFHAGGVNHRANASGNATTNQRSAVERHVLAHLHQRVLVNQHHLRE